jgi:putative heme-binding domain-containing protein
VESLGELQAPEGKAAALALLKDREPLVRRAAAVAAGKLGVREATEPLLKLANDSDAAVRVACLESLRRLKDPRAVPLAVAALGDRVTQLAAMELLAELGGPEHAPAVVDLARKAPPADVLAVAVRWLSAAADREGVSPAARAVLDHAIAEVHGATGALIRWTVSGPVSREDMAAIVERYARVPVPRKGQTDWQPMIADVPDWRVKLGPAKDAPPDAVRFAYADVVVTVATAVEFTRSGTGTADIWLNGKPLDRGAISGQLAKGSNRVLVRVGGPEFGLTFRHKSAVAAHEQLTRAALSRSGNAERGRKVFFDAEKSLCLKCHRVGDQGERVGPDLTGIGARFGRVYLVESILEPGRAVVPGFATLRVDLADGRAFTGVKVAESDTTLTLVDQEVKKHELKKADILDQRTMATSAMPDGVEKRLSEAEFVDLIAYLVSLKDRGPSR